MAKKIYLSPSDQIHNAYNIGDKVTYNGQHYVCTSDGNIYAPDVYGWEEA